MALPTVKTFKPLGPDEVPYQWLTELEGIGPKIADRINKTYNQAYKQYRKYGDDREQYGFNKALGGVTYKELDEELICKILTVNPYKLTDVRGISFERADKIAQQMYGYDKEDPLRHLAGNRYAVSRKGVLQTWQYRRERQKLELRNPEFEYDGVIVEGNNVWLPAELEAEDYIARFYQTINRDVVFPVASPGLKAVLNDGLNEEQLQAVKLGISGIRALALTGGAGTGKTRTLAAIARAAAATGKTVRVMAFSGKAAMRADEAMREGDAGDVVCSTIHRALGLPVGNDELLGEDIVVIDEASMIPNWLLAKVIRALQPEATLMLVGDPNQLPPIGYGTPFKDYLDLWLPHVHLVKNYRQANQQSIFQFAEAIRTQYPESYTPAATGVQAHFEIDPNDETFFDNIIRSVEALGLEEWQCVTWTNNIQQALNIHIQRLLNPGGERIFSYPCWDLRENGFTPRADVRVGDKVLVTDNDYLLEVFNGQTGIVTHATYRTLTVDFGFKTVEMDVEDATDLLCLGYVVTVHKSQGSGWQSVILYQPFEVKFQPRRFYYTSATRAKEALYVITPMSEREFWRNACIPDNDAPSTLQRRIKNI
jgi:exodeoxyribonuclease V alpha subunit